MAASLNESTVELNDWNAPTSEGQDIQTLPPADTGKDAWLFLICCFMIEALVWGFPFSFGVFQVYYMQTEPFASQASGIAAIGTTGLGIMYFTSPLISLTLQRWPKVRTPVVGSGLAIMVVALVAASFCNSIPGLLATQGVLYAIGGVLLYFPVMQLVDEWFIRRKGLAYGLMWGGTGVSGIAVPFLLQFLLDKYGFRTALRVWSVVLTVLTLPCLPFLRPRLPVAAVSAFRPNDLSFLARAPFWVYQAGNIFQSLGFFLPGLYIPSFAQSIGLPAYAGPLALALYNIAFCLGAVSVGSIIDRYHVSTAILVCSIGSMVSVFVFWGLADTAPMLYLFAILFGLFGCSFSVTWSGCANALRRSENNNNIDAGLVISLMAAGKGIGAVISGPLSEKLLEADAWRGHAEFAYGSGYGALVVFSGVSCALGSFAWFGRQFRMI